MNNKLYFDLTYLKVVLARIFFRIQGLGLLSFTNNDLFPFLARNFGSAQGSIKTPSPPAGIPHLCNFATLHLCNSNIQNKAKQSQTKPIFWRTNPVLSPKTNILTYFMKTFLCKTKPICFYPAPTKLVLWFIPHLL